MTDGGVTNGGVTDGGVTDGGVMIALDCHTFLKVINTEINYFLICFHITSSNVFVVLYNKSLNDCSLGKQLILFPSNLNVSQGSALGNIE